LENPKQIRMWNWSSRFPLSLNLFRVLCLFLNFCSHLISSLLLPLILVPGLVLSLRSTFLSSTGLRHIKIRGASRWEKNIARAIEFGNTFFFAAWISVVAPECLTFLFQRIKCWSLRFHFCCSRIELPLFSNFQFSTWARFRREDAHIDVFSIQELTCFADFWFFAYFSFPEFRNSSFLDFSRSSNWEFQNSSL